MTVPDPTNERAATTDGVLLGMRRYPRQGAAPVLLLHGLAQNLNGWDVPVEGHSLARHLSAERFDVWLGNFRGHGRDPHRSGSGHRPARVDDYGLLDVPAFLARVQRATGRIPLVVGHSMGGIALYIHLQGAVYDAERRVVGSEELAVQRNTGIAGAVLVGTPPRLFWHSRLGLRALLKRQYFEYNELLQQVLGHAATIHLLDAVPLHRVPTAGVSEWVDAAAGLPGPTGVIPGAVSRFMGHAVSEALAHTLWNPRNMSTVLVEAESRHTLDDAALPVLRQFVDWIRNGTAREYTVNDVRPPYVYSDHLDRVTCPVLWVGGELDRVCPPSVVRSDGVARLGSEDKALLVMRGFGHNDLRMGVKAPESLYPAITRWLRERASRTVSLFAPWRAERVDATPELPVPPGESEAEGGK